MLCYRQLLLLSLNSLTLFIAESNSKISTYLHPLNSSDTESALENTDSEVVFNKNKSIDSDERKEDSSQYYALNRDVKDYVQNTNHSAARNEDVSW